MPTTRTQFSVGIDGCFSSTETIKLSPSSSSHSWQYSDKTGLLRGR